MYMKSLIQKEKNMKPVILFLTFLFPTTFLSCAEKTELMAPTDERSEENDSRESRKNKKVSRKKSKTSSGTIKDDKSRDAAENREAEKEMDEEREEEEETEVEEEETEVEEEEKEDEMPIVQDPQEVLKAQGVAIYDMRCANCHNPLAESAKPGRTADELIAAENARFSNHGNTQWPNAQEAEALEAALAGIE